MNFELTASMMCAYYGNLEKEVRDLDEGGIDSFHIDIMDGRYVPNYAMSLNDMRYIRSATKKPLDVHLMIEHPNNHIKLFLESLYPGDTVYIHPEAEYHPSTTLQAIIDAGMIPGLAINPGTSVDSIVFGFISLTETPPLVTIASSMGRKPEIRTGNAFISLPKSLRCSFVMPLTFCSAGIPESFTATGISFAGRSFLTAFIKSRLRFSLKSR